MLRCSSRLRSPATRRSQAGKNVVRGAPGNAQLHYTVRDANGTVVLDDTQSANPTTPGAWQHLQVGLRLAQGGTVELRVETDGALGPDVFFDDVQIEHTAGTIVQEQHPYAYGAPMGGLNYTVGPTNYRHGYQGQFAEKDEETGLDAFELRMYDARIGRWSAPDPAGQFASPYVGMGNNPVSGVDPDGGLVPGVTLWQSIKSFIGIGMIGEVGSMTGSAFQYAATGSRAFGAGVANAAFGAAANAVRSMNRPTQSEINGHLFSNETEAYKRMLNLQTTNNKEMSAALVEGPSGKRGVWVFAFGANGTDGAGFDTSRDEPGTVLVVKFKTMYIEKVKYKVL